MEEKKQTTGKKLGTAAFVISEIIAVFVIIAVCINVFIEKKIDVNLVSALLMFQGSVFVTVWGAKASSNFAKKKNEK